MQGKLGKKEGSQVVNIKGKRDVSEFWSCKNNREVADQLPISAVLRVSTYLLLCLLCSLLPISPIGALLDVYYMTIATLLLTIFTFSLLSALSFSPEVYQLPPLTICAPTSLLPTSAAHQSHLTMTVATTDNCHM